MSLGKGTDEWQKLISDKITFKGPAADVKGKTEFIELNKSFFPTVKSYELSNSFEEGNFVCLESKYKVATPKGHEIILVMAEIYKVEKGIIQNIRVYYDAEEFRKEFGN